VHELDRLLVHGVDRLLVREVDRLLVHEVDRLLVYEESTDDSRLMFDARAELVSINNNVLRALHVCF